jgi:hypothetical protein
VFLKPDFFEGHFDDFGACVVEDRGNKASLDKDLVAQDLALSVLGEVQEVSLGGIVLHVLNRNGSQVLGVAEVRVEDVEHLVRESGRVEDHLAVGDVARVLVDLEHAVLHLPELFAGYVLHHRLLLVEVDVVLLEVYAFGKNLLWEALEL